MIIKHLKSVYKRFAEHRNRKRARKEELTRLIDFLNKKYGTMYDIEKIVKSCQRDERSKAMNDADIIKALECCVSSTTSEACDGCPLNFEEGCDSHSYLLHSLALDLINRQKAEKELDEKHVITLRLIGFQKQEINRIVLEATEEYKNRIRAEAITEFAERLKPVICAMVDAMWDGDMIKCRVSGCRKPSHISCGSEICLEENNELWMAEIAQIANDMKEGVNNA